MEKVDGKEKVQLVMAAYMMRFSEKEGIAYLATHGYDVKPAEYKSIGAKRHEAARRMLKHVSNNMAEHHANDMHTLELIEKDLWQMYHRCSKDRDKLVVLRDLRDLQPFKAAYRDAVAYVMDEESAGTLPLVLKAIP